ncbi:focadhesin isoform X2 [Bombus pyrosoma]|uniref:focadhesin isoform X2 n=1 Tax=Bombus pyrosoma TaxID=396416 RepID=UPI001CB9BF9E|nr:focadhesin isoform X2 [Bombus pyrosoma]
MDEIEYKLESTNPVLISHATSKLFESIKKKKCDRPTDHISKIPEFKLLLTKRDSTNVTLSISACQALIALVENGLWDINEALATFISSISSIKIRENGVKMLRPVFLYVLCNPSSDSMDYCMQQVWQLLIRLRHSISVQTEVLLWMCTAEIHSCINTNYRILELAERAASERNREYCTALLPMIVSLVIQLLQQGSDPTPNFHVILFIIDHCDSYIGNLVLTLMAEVITLCPAIYLYTTLQICTMITKKMSYNDIFFYTLIASIVKWIAYPSVLCSDALDMARDLASEMFTRTELTCNNETMFSNKLFTVFTHSDPCIQFYTELVHCLSIWNQNDILSWLNNISCVPTYLKDKCKLLISGLLLQSNEPQIVQLCCNILVDVSRERTNFGSHVLSLVLHKLTKCKSSIESKCLLLVMPELMITKENVPIVNHTLNRLLNGDKQLKYFIIELYLKALKKEPRCYRFLFAAIIKVMESDLSWYSDATCARAMKHICENYPEHGEKLVPLILQILNRSTGMNGGTASALALGCISALYKASVIDICSTWRVLSPKMEKEKRSIVLESLCELFADVAFYAPSSQYLEGHDHQLIDDIVSKLWKYTTCNDVKVIKAALKALASYRLEQLSLKSLPVEFRYNLVLPATYAKIPTDTVKKPEDVLPYIPGVCWIQMLQNINKMTLSAAGNLLISFVIEEVNSFRSGMYNWPQGEPQNFKYLPDKSVIRAVGEYLRKTNKSDSNNHCIVTECLRIFAHKYPKPLPNINWSFLKDTFHLSAEAKQYTLSIACHHATVSLSAKSFIEDYLLTYKSVNDAENFIWKDNEHPILYSNLEYLCQAVQPNIMKRFLETTLECAIKKMNENSIQPFHCIMYSYAQALRNPEICHANSTLLSTILEELLDKIDLTCDRFYPYFMAALELPMEHLERTTSPKVWWETMASKLKNAIAIRAELSLKKSNNEASLKWLNEIIGETFASTSSVQTYFLEIIQKVQTNMQFERSSSNWILELMTQVQGFLMDSSQNHNDKIQFYCNVLFISVISLSGLDSMLMKRDLVIKSQNVRIKLFPQALTLLSDKENWKHAIPQMMEWLNYMRTNHISNTYKYTFHQALISLRHNSYYKNVWTKYLSIKTDIDI